MLQDRVVLGTPLSSFVVIIRLGLVYILRYYYYYFWYYYGYTTSMYAFDITLGVSFPTVGTKYDVILVGFVVVHGVGIPCVL